MSNEKVTYEELVSQIAEWSRRANDGTIFEIEGESVSKAWSIVKQLIVNTSDDVLLNLCALNLLNAAIKTPAFENQLKRSFIKVNAVNLIPLIDKLRDDSIKYYYDDKQHYLFIEFDTIIFSFHDVPLLPELQKACEEIPIRWKNVRLQKVAQPLFSAVREKCEAENVIANKLSERDRLEIYNIVRSVLDSQIVESDDQGWCNMTSFASSLLSGGLKKEKYGYPRLLPLLEDALGPAVEKKTIGQVPFIKINLKGKSSDKESRTSNLKGDRQGSADSNFEKAVNNDDIDLTSKYKEGDSVEISSYGVIKKGKILSFEKQYIELELEDKRKTQIRYDAITTIEEMSCQQTGFDMSCLNATLETFLVKAGVTLSSEIETNAKITRIFNDEVWINTDCGVMDETGKYITCPLANIIGQDKDKIEISQRVHIFSLKDQTPCGVVLEMTYEELLTHLARLTSDISEETYNQIPISIKYVLSLFPENTDDYSELKELEAKVGNALGAKKNMSDNNSADEIKKGTTKKEIDLHPSADVWVNNNIESNGKTHKSAETSLGKAVELLKSDPIPGVNVVGKIPLMGDRDNVKKSPATSFLISLGDKSDTDELLPANGIMNRMGSKFGWITPLGDDDDIYVPAQEIIYFSNIIDAPQRGDKVYFSRRTNEHGPIATCVHKQCSRSVMEDLIDKFCTSDSRTATLLRNQLDELEKANPSLKPEENENDQFVEFLTKVGIDPNAPFSPEESEKLFVELLSVEEYIEAMQLLINKVIAVNPSKSYDLFNRSYSYAKSHGEIEQAISFMEKAIETFSSDEKKVKYFSFLLNSAKSIKDRIRITPASLRNSISVSEMVYGSIPEYVKNEIISYTGFSGLKADKETIRQRLYKRDYIDEVRGALMDADNKSDDLIYLTLIKLELSFNPEKYNPTSDWTKFLVNRANNMIATGNLERYDEARYLLRLSFANMDFEKGIDMFPPLYLMTLGGYSAAEIEGHMKGRANYKFDDLLKNAIKMNPESDWELFLLSRSNSYLATRIRRAYGETHYAIENLEKFEAIYQDFKIQMDLFKANPIENFKLISEFLYRNPILVGNEVEVMRDDSPKLVLQLTLFNTVDKYSKMKDAYDNSLGIIEDMRKKLIANATMIGYECLLPGLDNLEKAIRRGFEDDEQRADPKIEVYSVGEANRSADDAPYEAVVMIKNTGESSRDVFIRRLLIFGRDLNTNIDFPIDRNLSGGDECSVSLKLDVIGECVEDGVAAPEFRMIYEDIYAANGSNVEKECTGPIRINLRKESFTEIENKFKADGSALRGDSDMFYGRSDILKELEDEIMGSYNSQSAVYGQKRSGKSSLKNRIIANLLEKYDNVICADFSIQEYSKNSESLEKWILEKIAYEISGHEKVREHFPKKDVKDFFKKYDDPFEALREYMLIIRDFSDLKNTHIVIMIDEFTSLYQSIKDGETDENFMKRWKALVESRGVDLQSVVFAQDTLPLFIDEPYAHNAFAIFNPKPLTYLNEGEALELINNPIKELRFHEDSDKTIFDYTAGSAYFTQIMCNKLVMVLNKKKTYNVTKVEIEEVVTKLCSELEVSNFECLLKEADDSSNSQNDEYGKRNEYNESVLRAVAKKTRIGGGCFPEELESEFEPQRVAEVLEHLFSRKVLSKEEGKYSIKVKLFKRWILSH